ncbi:MAG: GrpB family protein [Tepidibacillus sp.]
METKRKVEVVCHQSEWKQQFDHEANILREVFGNLISDIHHIGSTAIPGIKAKPIIDMLIEVKEIDEVDHFNYKLYQLGYISKGENGIVNRRFFIKGDEFNRTHHVHIFQTGNKEIDRHIRFRDYLIKHPDEAEFYSNLKEELAKKYPYDIEEYIKGKDQFIKVIDQKAAKKKNLD